jgi:hypothetical protein
MNHSPLLRSQLLQAVPQVLTRHAQELRMAAEQHASIEAKWLQQALYQQLLESGCDAVRELRDDLPGNRKFVDLVLSHGGERLLVELKVFVASYGGGHRCVTDTRGTVIRDLRALSRRLNDMTDGCLLWLAYPVPAHRRRDWSVKHLREIAAASACTREIIEPIALERGNYAHVYLSDVKPATIRIEPAA